MLFGIRKFQNKMPIWQEKFKKELHQLIFLGKTLGIPTILAITLFSIGLTLLNPFVPPVLGMIAYDFIKDLCSNLIWKMFESPMKLSAYYRSGELEADVTRELKSTKNMEYRRKVARLFEQTEVLTITLKELISHQDRRLLNEFLQEIQKYPGILTTNSKASLLEEVRDSSCAFELTIVKENYVRELESIEETVIEQSAAQQPLPSGPIFVKFPWGWWIFFWVVSMIIGAAFLAWLFCSFTPYCSANSFQSILLLSPTIVQTPTITQTIVDTPTLLPHFTLTPVLSSTVTLTKTLTSVPTNTMTPSLTITLINTSGRLKDNTFLFKEPGKKDLVVNIDFIPGNTQVIYTGTCVALGNETWMKVTLKTPDTPSDGYTGFIPWAKFYNTKPLCPTATPSR